MITKTLDDNTISFIAEDSDDLLTIRRLIKGGDKIIGETTRVIKQEKEYSRPDKGERIKIRLAIEVEKISLDDVLDRIRVGGIITDSNNDAVPHGSHHSFVIKIEQPFNLEKKTQAQKEKEGKYPDIHTKSSDLSCFVNAKSFYPNTSNRIQGEIYDEKHSGSQSLHSVNFDQHQNNHKVP